MSCCITWKHDRTGKKYMAYCIVREGPSPTIVNMYRTFSGVWTCRFLRYIPADRQTDRQTHHCNTYGAVPADNPRYESNGLNSSSHFPAIWLLLPPLRLSHTIDIGDIPSQTPSRRAYCTSCIRLHFSISISLCFITDTKLNVTLIVSKSHVVYRTVKLPMYLRHLDQCFR